MALSRVSVSTDHPRGCGEHAWFVARVGCYLGSSPRMRGAHPLGQAGGIHAGIIPADAGSTRAYEILPFSR